MPTNIQIIHPEDFIRANVDGNLDREASMRLLTEIASAGASLGNHQVLVDTRRSSSLLTAADLWFLAETFANNYRGLSQKTAVLCPLKDFNFAEFFALCAENRGLRVAAFTSFEDAIEWLIAGWSDN